MYERMNNKVQDRCDPFCSPVECLHMQSPQWDDIRNSVCPFPFTYWVPCGLLFSEYRIDGIPGSQIGCNPNGSATPAMGKWALRCGIPAAFNFCGSPSRAYVFPFPCFLHRSPHKHHSAATISCRWEYPFRYHHSSPPDRCL